MISLEVGEHLPPQFEDIFLKNLDRHNSKGIILSWAIEGQGGFGHFNEKSNDYIKQKMHTLNYYNDLNAENTFRASAKLPHFKNTLMVFRKYLG